MKTRIGFVSNSSTSSFVIIGCKILEDEASALEIDCLLDSGDAIYVECGRGESYYVKGDILVECEDDYIPASEFTLAELQQKFEAAAKSQGVDISSIKLLMGTYSC